ncbi:hypothetical protein C8Q77DRAFT_1158607 [Trametes polyzona]|nr:hypothetical protein C8Q77DRAFT_1158607 [Trametes polyzona]
MHRPGAAPPPDVPARPPPALSTPAQAAARAPLPSPPPSSSSSPESSAAHALAASLAGLSVIDRAPPTPPLVFSSFSLHTPSASRPGSPVSTMPKPSTTRPWPHHDPDSDGAVYLASPEDVLRYASLLHRYDSDLAQSRSHTRHPSSTDEDEDEDEDEGDDFLSAGSSPPSRSSSPESTTAPSSPSRPPHADAHPSASAHTSSIRSLTLNIPPPALTPAFPTSALVRILAAARASGALTHVYLAYTESLLAHDPSIDRALALALARTTHLRASRLGPRACAFLRDLQCRLEDAELDFDEQWAAEVCGAAPPPATSPSPEQLSQQGAFVPSLPNGDSSGLPTPAPTPATTPAATATAYPSSPSRPRSHRHTSSQSNAYTGDVLPDPVPLLAHSMRTLRVLRASGAVLATVADTVRYPAVRALRLRLVGVPIVTPLVHAFPAVQDVYIYTPYDGCGVRAAVPALPSSTHAPGPAHPAVAQGGERDGWTIALPPIDATREANRTSQMYSSFPPLARVSGFAPGLYALGLTCPIAHLEIGNVAPRLWLGAGSPDRERERERERKRSGSNAIPPLAGGVNEAEMVRRVVADTTPSTLGFTLGRGWWAYRHLQRIHLSGHRRRGEAASETEALRVLFDPGEEGSADGWAGVKTLAVRVEEAGTWADVTRDLAALLAPLASTLTTFVLRWDRTSVPFDRVLPDDNDYDGRTPLNDADASLSSNAAPIPRIEAFARKLAEDLPALRYVCAEVVRDAPAPALRTPPPSHTSTTSTSAQGSGSPPLSSSPRSPESIWSAEAQNAVASLSSTIPSASKEHAPTADLDVRFATGPPRITSERRFWRVERTLPAAMGEGGAVAMAGAKPWMMCLDPLDAEMGARVLREEGLAFEDPVRY